MDPNVEESKNEINNEIDYVWVIKSPFLDIQKITNQFPSATFIFDGSNKWSSIKYWKTYCVANNIEYRDLKNDGYFEIRE